MRGEVFAEQGLRKCVKRPDGEGGPVDVPREGSFVLRILRKGRSTARIYQRAARNCVSAVLSIC